MIHLFVLLLPLVLAGCAASGGHLQDFPSQTNLASADERAGENRRSAPPAPAQPLDFTDLAALLLERNPEWQAQISAVRAAEGRVRQAGLYPNPSAEAEIEEFDVGEAGYDEAETTLRISQPILWGSKRADAIAAAQAKLDVQRRNLEQVQLTLFTQLREVYDKLLYLQRAQALNDELTSLSQQSLQIARSRFELKASPQSDVSKAEVEVFDLVLARRDLERQQEQALEQLAALLGGTQISPGQINGEFGPELDDVSTSSMRHRLLREHPGLRLARAEREAAQARLSKAMSERLPDLSISAGYGHIGAQSNNVLQGAIGIEIPIFDRNQGAIAAAKAEIEASENREAAREHQLVSQFNQTMAALEAARIRKRYHARQVLPSAKRAFEQVKEGYQAGKLGFLDLIDAQRTLTAARLQQLQLIQEIRQSETRLFGLLGPELMTTEKKSSHAVSEGERQ